MKEWKIAEVFQKKKVYSPLEREYVSGNKSSFHILQWWMPYYGYIIKGSNSQNEKTLPWYYGCYMIWMGSNTQSTA